LIQIKDYPNIKIKNKIIVDDIGNSRLRKTLVQIHRLYLTLLLSTLPASVEELI